MPTAILPLYGGGGHAEHLPEHPGKIEGTGESEPVRGLLDAELFVVEELFSRGEAQLLLEERVDSLRRQMEAAGEVEPGRVLRQPPVEKFEHRVEPVVGASAVRRFEEVEPDQSADPGEQGFRPAAGGVKQPVGAAEQLRHLLLRGESGESRRELGEAVIAGEETAFRSRLQVNAAEKRPAGSPSSR